MRRLNARLGAFPEKGFDTPSAVMAMRKRAGHSKLMNSMPMDAAVATSPME